MIQPLGRIIGIAIVVGPNLETLIFGDISSEMIFYGSSEQ
jgi:hypothetical protein